VLVLAEACRASEPCHADDYLGCTCADGSLGYAACVDGAFGSCAYCGATPGLDATFVPDGEGGATGEGGAQLALYAPCSGNAECASGLCYAYTAKGSHCTHPCTSDADCSPPSPQCTPKGVCKLP
jgi:hypothetical protein